MGACMVGDCTWLEQNDTYWGGRSGVHRIWPKDIAYEI